MCPPRALCWVSTCRSDALPWLRWGRFNLSGCDALPCWGAGSVPPSAVVTQQVLPLSVGWGVLPVLRAGLPATSRSPAQHKRLTGFITMGAGWQGSEAMRCRRGASGADRTWESMSCDLARRCGVEESPSTRKAGVGRLNRSHAQQHLTGGWGSAQERWAEQRASHRCFHTGWVPRRKGSWGKSMFAEYTFFLRL